MKSCMNLNSYLNRLEVHFFSWFYFFLFTTFSHHVWVIICRLVTFNVLIDSGYVFMMIIIIINWASPLLCDHFYLHQLTGKSMSIDFEFPFIIISSWSLLIKSDDSVLIQVLIQDDDDDDGFIYLELINFLLPYSLNDDIY